MNISKYTSIDFHVYGFCVSGSKRGGVGGRVPLPAYTMLSLLQGKHISRNVSERILH